MARESVCLKYTSVVFLLYDALNPISKPGGPVFLVSVGGSRELWDNWVVFKMTESQGHMTLPA